MPTNITSYALPAPLSPLVPASEHEVAKSQYVETPTTRAGRDRLASRFSTAGLMLQTLMGIDDVQVDGAENFHGVTPEAARCLLVAHALDPRDAILTTGSGLKSLRNPQTGAWNLGRPLMRQANGLQGTIEAFLIEQTGLKPLVTQVRTPGKKRLEGEALAESKRQNTASLEAGCDKMVREGGIQIIFPQGNVRGPGTFDVAAVGAVKAFSHHEGRPVVFIPMGITYEPRLRQSVVDPRWSIKAFINFGAPVVVDGPASHDSDLARALEMELAKTHTFTASGIAGAYVFGQRDQGKTPRLLENEFKVLVTQFVDRLRENPEVKIDAALKDTTGRDAYLHDVYQSFVSQGFINPYTRNVTANVGARADMTQPAKERADARTEGLALTDPLRYFGNRSEQLMARSPTIKTAFTAASQAAAGRLGRRRNHVNADSDAVRDACSVM